MVKDVDVSLLKSFGVVKTANPFIKYIGYLLVILNIVFYMKKQKYVIFLLMRIREIWGLVF